MKFLTRRISAESMATFRKIHFPATLGGLLEFLCYLNFCVKHKNVFISETEQDRTILKQFLTHRVSEFGGHLEFLR